MNKKRLVVLPDDIIMRLLIESQSLGYTEVSHDLLKNTVYELTVRLPAVAKLFRFYVDPLGKTSEPFDQAIFNLTNSQMITRTLFGTTEMIAARRIDYTTKMPKGVVEEIKYAARFLKVTTR